MSDYTILLKVISDKMFFLHTVLIVCDSSLFGEQEDKLNSSMVISIFSVLANCMNLKSLTLRGEGMGMQMPAVDEQDIESFFRELPLKEFRLLEELEIQSKYFGLLDYVLLKLRAPSLKRLNLDMMHYSSYAIYRLFDFMHFHSRNLQNLRFRLTWCPVLVDFPVWSSEIIKQGAEIGKLLKNVVTLDVELTNPQLFQPLQEVFRQLPKTNSCLHQLNITMDEWMDMDIESASSILHESLGFSSLRVLNVYQLNCVFDFAVLKDKCPLVETIILHCKYIENIHFLPLTCRHLFMRNTVPSPEQWRHLVTMDHRLETLNVKIGTENRQDEGSSLEISATLCQQIYRPSFKEFSIYPVICSSRAQHRITERLLPIVVSIICRHDREIDTASAANHSDGEGEYND